MIAARGETYELRLFPRKPDSPYEWEKEPSLTFFARPAGQMETRSYRITQGVQGNNDGIYIYCTNLPKEVKVGDKVAFLGKEWTVQTIGFYFDSNLIANAKVFSSEYLEGRCPKGLSLS